MTSQSESVLPAESTEQAVECKALQTEENEQAIQRILATVKNGTKVHFEAIPAEALPVEWDAEHDFRMERAYAALEKMSGCSHRQLEVGSLIAPIIRKEAYREEGLNLDGFCHEKFGYSRQRVMEWVVASEMHQWLDLDAPIGNSLEALRELRKVIPKKRREVWKIAWERDPHRGPTQKDISRIARKEGFLIPQTKDSSKAKDVGPIPSASPIPLSNKIEALGTPKEALAAIEELQALVLANHDSSSKEAVLARHLLHYHQRMVENFSKPIGQEHGVGPDPQDEAKAPVEDDRASGDAHRNPSPVVVAGLAPEVNADSDSQGIDVGRNFRPLASPSSGNGESPNTETVGITGERRDVALELKPALTGHTPFPGTDPTLIHSGPGYKCWSEGCRTFVKFDDDEAYSSLRHAVQNWGKLFSFTGKGGTYCSFGSSHEDSIQFTKETVAALNRKLSTLALKK